MNQQDIEVYKKASTRGKRVFLTNAIHIYLKGVPWETEDLYLKNWKEIG